jgi:Flp pilus assembly pilin Flp
MKLNLRRLLIEEQGQDLVEYALLGACIGLVGVAAFTSIESAIKTTYLAWNTNNNNNWVMPDPGSGGS